MSEETQIKNKLQKGHKLSVGTKNHKAKLTEDQVKTIYCLSNSGSLTPIQIARIYNITSSQVCKIKFKQQWKHILK